MTSSHHVPADVCPHCARFIDAATGISGQRAPRPGDMTMCWYCGKWSAWQQDGKLGTLSPDQTVHVLTAPECIVVDRRWHASRHARGGGA